MKDKKVKNALLYITYTVFLLFIMLNFKTVWEILGKLISILSPFFYGLILAFLLNIPFKFFKNRLFKKIDKKNKSLAGLRTALSLLCSYLIIIGIITVIISVLIPELAKSIESLTASLPEYGRQAEKVLNNFFETIQNRFDFIFTEESNIESIANTIFEAISGGDASKFIQNITSNIFPAAVTTVKALISELYNWIVAIIISIYLLVCKEKLQEQGRKMVIAYTKPKTQRRIFKITDLIVNKCGKFIIGKIVDSVIIGIICLICMSIFKFDYALLISVVVGVTNVIPVFGPFIGAVPSALLLLIINPIECLWFIIFIIILQQIDGNIIGPKILGNQIGISGFWIMFSVILGGGLFGIVGMILGVPIFAVIYSILGENVNARLALKGRRADGFKTDNTAGKCVSEEADANIEEQENND